MKKVIKVLFLIFALTLFCDNANAEFYSCNNNAETDTCVKKVYKYSKTGNLKPHAITIGVFHFKNVLESNDNEEYIKSFNSCGVGNEYCSNNADSLNLFQADDAVISVDSSKNKFPVAICAFPIDSNGNAVVVRDENITNYVYFSEKNVNNAVNNGYCKSDDVYYTESSIVKEEEEKKKEESRVCENNVHLFNMKKGDEGFKISTHHYQTGNTSICNITITYNENMKQTYNHYNSSEMCTASNYKLTCYDNGSPTSDAKNCYLYSCNIGDDYFEDTKQSDKEEVGLKCKLYNEEDSSDYIEFATVSKDYIKNNGEVSQAYGSQFEIRHKGNISTESMKFLNHDYNASCPMYIYYDANDDNGGSRDPGLWVIIPDDVELNRYKNENKENFTRKYRLINANDSESLDKDDITNTGVPEDWVDPIKKEYKCGIIGEETMKFVKTAIDLIKIIIPVLVVAFGMIDFLKVVVSGEEKSMKSAWNSFIKRVIFGVAFMLIPSLLNFIIGLFGFSDSCIAIILK